MARDRGPGDRAAPKKERLVSRERSRSRPRRRKGLSPFLLFFVGATLLSAIALGAWLLLRRTPPAAKAETTLATASAQAEPAEPAPSAPDPSAAEEPAPSASAAEDSTAEVVGTGPLAAFFNAANALKHGRRHESVRILWLGDSHTFADFWPDAVRRPLADRFGGGGPGFLFTGVTAYRHAAAHFSRDGEWEVEPDRPALSERQEDGVFGLGGMRGVAMSPESTLKIEITREGLRGDAVWDLCFRLPAQSSGFRIQGDGMKPILVDTAAYEKGKLEHVTWRTPAPATVTIDGVDGSPEFCGVVVEGSTPGIVLDSVGIIGARIATALSWEQTAWIAEARRRKPTLAVLAYGTNECGDGVPVSTYAGQYARMMERLRAAAPDVACVIVGPTDRVIKLGSPGRVKQITLVQQQAAASLGCAFFSTQEAMGGEGGFTKWASVDGAFTSGDGVHLAPNGYSELGAQMVRLLLSERPGLN